MSTMRRESLYKAIVFPMVAFGGAILGLAAHANSPFVDLNSPDGPVWRIYSQNGSEGIGLSGTVATGDVNGDGYADVILGTNGEPRTVNATYQTKGAVLIFYGDTNRRGASTIPIASKPTRDETHIFAAAPAETPSQNTRLGGAVASEDFNRDGFDDVVFTATYDL